MTRTPAAAGTPGVTREFVGLDSPTARRAGSGGHPCQGLYHRGVGRKPKVAMIATHYQIDFSEHYLADYMATRGIGFLGWNTRYRGYESSFLLDHALVDIGVGVRWLREVQGVETIVLLGNSGGGSLMAAYQAQAVDPQVTPLEGMRPAAGLTDLPPADGYVASAAHPGRPDVLTAWMDASVVDENDPIASDPDLDLFDQRNGPSYPRNSSSATGRHRSPATTPSPIGSETELKRVHAAGFSDRPFTVLRTWADPRMVDPAIEPTSARPTCATPASRSRRTVGDGIAAACTLRNWLGMWSLGTPRPAPNPTWPHRLPRTGDQRRTGHRRVSDGRSAHLRRAASDRQYRSVRSTPTTTSPPRAPAARRPIRSRSGSRSGGANRRLFARALDAESPRTLRSRRQGLNSLHQNRIGSTSATAPRMTTNVLSRASRRRGGLARAAADHRRRPRAGATFACTCR